MATFYFLSFLNEANVASFSGLAPNSYLPPLPCPPPHFPYSLLWFYSYPSCSHQSSDPLSIPLVITFTSTCLCGPASATKAPYYQHNVAPKTSKTEMQRNEFPPPLILSPPQVLSYQSQVLIIARRPWRHLFIICIPTIDHRFSISQSKRMKCLKKEKVQCFQSDFLMWWWRNSQTNAFQTYIQVIIRSICRLTFLYKDIFCINCAGLKC